MLVNKRPVLHPSNHDSSAIWCLCRLRCIKILSLADGVFGNYCALDAFEVLGSVSKNECEDFLKAFMTPDRLAMSVISPVKA